MLGNRLGPQRRLRRQGERPFAADQQPGQVELAVVQHVVQVISGPIDPRLGLMVADDSRLALDQLGQSLDDLAAPGHRIDVRIVGHGMRSGLKGLPVGQHDLQAFDVPPRRAVPEPIAAGIVEGQHAAHRGDAAGRRIRTELPPEGRQVTIELAQNHARLDAKPCRPRHLRSAAWPARNRQRGLAPAIRRRGPCPRRGHESGSTAPRHRRRPRGHRPDPAAAPPPAAAPDKCSRRWRTSGSMHRRRALRQKADRADRLEFARAAGPWRVAAACLPKREGIRSLNLPAVCPARQVANPVADAASVGDLRHSIRHKYRRWQRRQLALRLEHHGSQRRQREQSAWRGGRASRALRPCTPGKLPTLRAAVELRVAVEDFLIPADAAARRSDSSSRTTGVKLQTTTRKSSGSFALRM